MRAKVLKAHQRKKKELRTQVHSDKWYNASQKQNPEPHTKKVSVLEYHGYTADPDKYTES